MPRKIVAGNWKMNTSFHEAIELARSLRASLDGMAGVERVLIPPFPWLLPVHDAISGSDLGLGAQNCYTEPKGAYTGEVSAEMLADVCSYIIAGHSERRHILGESNDLVAKKVAAILRAGLSAILCVGETLAEREAGSAENVVGRQLDAGLSPVDSGKADMVVIGYEPVWAIGTGVAASADDAQEMAEFVRASVADRFGNEVAGNMSILYGGSVKSDNAGQFMACRDIDGALVGGASLDASEFSAIARASTEHAN